MKKTNYKNFIISASFNGEKCAAWDQRNHNNYIITVKNADTGLRTRFDFWSSIAHPELESKYDLLNAFYCFVSDAVSGVDTFEDFCAELGYDPDSRNAEKIHNACRRAYKKITRIAPGVDVYDLLNDLSENYG